MWVTALVVLAFASTCSAMMDVNETAPVTVLFNTHLLMGTGDIPLTDPLMVRTVTGVDPDQFHIAHFGLGEVLFSWVSGDAQVGPVVFPPQSGTVASTVFFGRVSGNYTSMASGFSTSYVQDYSPYGLSYASALIHQVWVAGLVPGATYYYVVGDKRLSALSPEFNFTCVAAPTISNLPFSIGFMGDTGQTYNTSVTLNHTLATKSDMLIITGDLTYADDWHYDGHCSTTLFNACTPAQLNSCGQFGNTTCPRQTYQPKWDAFSRLFSPLLATVPTLTCNGNHEIETSFTNYTQTSYNTRFPNPFKNRTYLNPKGNNNNANMTNGSNLYYSIDVPGAHIVFLTPYIIGDTFSNTSAQYMWLEADLASVNRTLSPWLITVFHAPWYNTFVSHYLENEAMRQAYEPLFYAYGVDLAFHGHVHAYTRTKPVYNNTLDKCGAVYITIGDAGNIEEVSATFIDLSPPSFCSAPYNRTWPWYQPQKAYPAGTTSTGGYCYTTVQPWVAWRESSFGHGKLTIESPTSATWSWNRNQDSVATVADSVTWQRDNSCVPPSSL